MSIHNESVPQAGNPTLAHPTQAADGYAIPTERLETADHPGSTHPPESLYWAVPRPGSPTSGMLHYMHDESAPMTKLTARIILLQNLLARALEKAYESDKEHMFHLAGFGEIPEALVYARQRSRELECAFLGFCQRTSVSDGPSGMRIMMEVVDDMKHRGGEW